VIQKHKQKRKPYKGSLNTKIIVPEEPLPPDLLFNEGDIETLTKKYTSDLKKYRDKYQSILVTERLKKTFLLFDHYEIDGNDENKWEKLALSLAIDHVEGFQEKQSRTNKGLKWNSITYAKLYFDVMRFIENSHQKENITSACHELIKKEPWITFLKGQEYSNPKPKNLQTAYSRSKKSGFVKIYLYSPNRKLKARIIKFIDQNFQAMTS